MICPKCGTQYNGNFCPNGCNSPYYKKKIPIYKKWWFWVILLVILSAIWVNDENDIIDNPNPIDNKIDINETVKNNACYRVSNSNLIFSKDKSSAFVYYEILNAGDTNLYLKSAVFDIQDKNGHLLQTEDMVHSCPNVIKPGEKGYFYKYIFFDENISLDDNFELIPSLEVLKATDEAENYTVTDTSLSFDKDFKKAKLTGRITNNYSEKSSAIMYVQTIYYDKNDEIIYIDGTTLGKEIKPNETVSFDSTAYMRNYIGEKEINDYKVIAQNCYYCYDSTEAKQIN